MKKLEYHRDCWLPYRPNLCAKNDLNLVLCKCSFWWWKAEDFHSMEGLKSCDFHWSTSLYNHEIKRGRHMLSWNGILFSSTGNGEELEVASYRYHFCSKITSERQGFEISCDDGPRDSWIAILIYININDLVEARISRNIYNFSFLSRVINKSQNPKETILRFCT